MNNYTILGIAFGVLALIFGAIGTFKSRKSTKKEIVDKIENKQKQDSLSFQKIVEEMKKVSNAQNKNTTEIITAILEKEKPNIEIDLYNPVAPLYVIRNLSKEAIAEDILLAFGIFDLNIKPVRPLPIPTLNIKYVNPSTQRGGSSVLGNFGNLTHRFFGFISLTCRGCTEDRRYWIYINGEKSFYSESKKIKKFEEDLYLGFSEKSDDDILNQLFPENKRVYIKKKL